MPARKPKTWPAIWLLLVLLVSACASPSQKPLPPAVTPQAIFPPLPTEARQPTPPPICSNGCSKGLMTLRTSLLDSLTQPTSPDKPASASSTK